MKSLSMFLLLCCIYSNLQAQNNDLNKIRTEKKELSDKQAEVNKALENALFQNISNNIKSIGYPKIGKEEELVTHCAMALAFNPIHKQAAWVMHIIPRDIKFAKNDRTNDFRVDSLVTKGCALEKDYFLRFHILEKKDSFFSFGYDRGHLAPSADFLWSKKAMSESFFYSNMSPQIPEFNEGKWAELENNVREYVKNKGNTDVYVITAPLLEKNLPTLKSDNHVSIPNFYYKIVLDTTNKQGIAFIMPNRAIYEEPIGYFACTIDSIEKLTGYDFFPNLDKKLQQQLESKFDMSLWQAKVSKFSAIPINPKKLKPGQCNTLDAKKFIGTYKQVCGTLISVSGNNIKYMRILG